MKGTAYEEKLKAIISDPNKFSQTDNKPAGMIKNKVNSIAEKY